jgi:hypothetical protein
LKSQLRIYTLTVLPGAQFQNPIGGACVPTLQTD